MDTDNRSLAEIFAELPEEDRQAILDGMSEEEQAALQYDAEFWLRPNQKIGEEGDWHITALIAGRGFGKAAGVGTPTPTPHGWTTLGELQVGDQVFAEDGSICNVTEVHPIHIPEKQYRVTFSDDSYIDVCEDHLWTTWDITKHRAYGKSGREVVDSVIPEDWAGYVTPDNRNRWSPEEYTRVISLMATGKTYQEIGNLIGRSMNAVQLFVSGLRTGRQSIPTEKVPYINTKMLKDTLKIGGDRFNHRIPNNLPLQLPEKDLPIDPYVLGILLGDGDTLSGSCVSGEAFDLPWLRGEFESLGYVTTTHKQSKPEYSQHFGMPGMRATWKALGLNNGKFIPKEYFRASHSQRLALVQGLIDSDGSVDSAGKFRFYNTNYDLVQGFAELVRTLGQQPYIYKVNRVKPDHHLDSWQVVVSSNINLARLPRKRDKFKKYTGLENRARCVVSVEPLEELIEMRCITVDSKNSTFICGETFVINHNTLAVSYWIKGMALSHPGCRIGIGGRTSGDVRRIIIEGESGILAISSPEERPEFKQQKAALYWPNGSMAELHSSEAPDAARGVQYHYTVGDEFAAWKTNVDSSGATLYSNLIAATRLGKSPRLLLATTPKRTAVMRDLMDRAKDPTQGVRIITGSTFDNTTLSKKYLLDLKRQYGNTDLAKQELEGKMLDDAEGVVFTTDMIENSRDLSDPPTPPLRIISVDPTVASDPKNSDECGIMAMGATSHADPSKRHAYLLEDYSLRASPDIWVKEVVRAAKEHNTKFVVVEKNQGGDLLRLLILAEDPSLKVFPVTATKGKLKRAEPVATAMAQGRVHLCDEFPTLEEQLLFYDPDNSGYSPDRMDAFVWGAIALIIDPPKGLRIGHYKATSATNRKLPTGIGTGRTRGVSTSRSSRSSMSSARSRSPGPGFR